MKRILQIIIGAFFVIGCFAVTAFAAGREAVLTASADKSSYAAVDTEYNAASTEVKYTVRNSYTIIFDPNTGHG